MLLGRARVRIRIRASNPTRMKDSTRATYSVGLSLETNGIRHISWFVAAVPGKVGRLNHLDKEQSRNAGTKRDLQRNVLGVCTVEQSNHMSETNTLVGLG